MWGNKSKNSSITPTLKSKIETRINRGFIITPDNFQILVGANEDLVLIYQDEGTLWNSRQLKTAGNSWSNKTKVPLA
jgi:hypothetical protein